MKEPGKGYGSNPCPPGCTCGKHHMAGVTMGRKFCTSCKHWRHLIYFHVHTKDTNGNPVRWQSRCETCHRIHKRITEGRRLRGFRYNQRSRRTAAQQNRIERMRHNRRMTSRRKGDPFVPLKPLASALEDIIVEFESQRRLAMYLGMDESRLRKIIACIDVRLDGSIVKAIDIRLSQADAILTKLEIPLSEVYDDKRYPWLYDDRRPKRYPTGRDHPRRKARRSG